MSQSAVLGFAAVSFAVIAVPGPSVLFAVGRAIASGRRVALLAVLGNASGVFVQVVLVALGLGVIVTGSEAAYTTLTLVGASYLVWLGISAIRHRHDAARAVGADARAVDAHVPDAPAVGADTPVPESPLPTPMSRPLRDGFMVGVTNPKSLVFLAALLPQYVDPGSGMVVAQMVALGGIFCLIAIASDSVWAVLAARARLWLARDPRRLTWAAVAGGVVMVSLGLLLLTS